MGCVVTMVDNGQQAVDKWKELGTAIDLILLDTNMPVMDGALVTFSHDTTGSAAALNAPERWRIRVAKHLHSSHPSATERAGPQAAMTIVALSEGLPWRPEIIALSAAICQEARGASSLRKQLAVNPISFSDRS